MTHIVAFSIGLILFVVLFYFGQPWLAFVAMTGPILAWVLSFLGVTGAVIMTWLSGGGTVPIVAGVGFIVTFALVIASFFII